VVFTDLKNKKRMLFVFKGYCTVDEKQKSKTTELRPASSSPCSTAPLAQLHRCPTAMEKELCLAAASGDYTKVRRLLEQGVSPDARRRGKGESLALARLAEFLLFFFFGQNGLSVRFHAWHTDHDTLSSCWTSFSRPLPAAAAPDRRLCPCWLPAPSATQHGSESFWQTPQRRPTAHVGTESLPTPLYAACFHGNAQCVQLLLEAGLQDVNAGFRGIASDLRGMWNGSDSVCRGSA
jgi:hypothetical protein